LVLGLVAALVLAACGSDDEDAAADEEITLRLGVSMTPAELETFQQGLDAIRAEHPNWNIELEQTPQDGVVEKINSQIASDTLPDVVQVQGLNAQPWIRQGAFLDLTTRANDSANFDIADFNANALSQFEYEDKVYGIPFTVAPDVVYYNKAMFDAAGLDYPTDDWTFEDLRELAIQLTLDADGNTPEDEGFDPNNIVQWGMNVTPSNIFGRYFAIPFGGDPCVNPECTEMDWTTAEVVDALEWWASLSAEDYAAPYDPYSGNQTGVPGDPFVAGLAAMGYNGFFAVGQLNATGEIQYDVVEPPVGPAGVRATPISTSGWAIAENSANSEAAWELIQELSSAAFMEQYWADPGHGVPARTSAADAILESETAPENRQAIIDALEYGEVLYPNTAGAFEAYGKTQETFFGIMSGETPVEEGARQITDSANEILSKDRSE
jgi:multiple sugar transport system substrate-binding protein